MSEQTTTPSPTKRANPVATLLVAMLGAAILGGIVWFVLGQSGDSGEQEPMSPPTSSASAPAQPSATHTPSASPTERPLPTADESLTAELGRGYELQDDRGNIVPLCEATRFVAAYNSHVGAPQPGNSSTLRTTEGPIDVTPYSNDVDGYRGVISASC